jgi:ribosome-associated protein
MPILKDIKNLDFGAELEFQTSRSSGPGGQNVNKVESKVELRFSISNSVLFTPDEKLRLKEKLANQLIDEDSVRVICQENRSQLKNKDIALKKFKEILQEVFTVPKKRKPTVVPAAVTEKRLLTKKRDAEVKAKRGKVDW